MKVWQLLAGTLGLTLIVTLLAFGPPGPRSARTRGFQRLWGSKVSKVARLTLGVRSYIAISYGLILNYKLSRSVLKGTC